MKSERDQALFLESGNKAESTPIEDETSNIEMGHLEQNCVNIKNGNGTSRR